jgi:hypothetical protein
MRAKNSKKNATPAAPQAAEGLSFMKPIEAEPTDEAPKLSRAERRAQQAQGKSHGKIQNMRSQAVPSHRNFTSRRSGG